MLSRIEIKNYRGFGENFVFDLTQPKNYEFNSFAIKNNVVNKAIIYGANGSGKSNLGYAIFDIIGNLTDYKKKNDYTNDYLNAESKNGYARFSFWFQFGKDKVNYSYTKSGKDRLLTEQLVINSNIMVDHDYSLDSNIPNIGFKNTEAFRANFKTTELSIVKLVDRSTILDPNIEENRIFKTFMGFIGKMLFFSSDSLSSYYGYAVETDNFWKSFLIESNIQGLEKFFTQAGLKYKLKIFNEGGQDKIGVSFDDKILEFNKIASSGTKRLLMLYFWLTKLKNVSFVYIDEFDAFYHNNLASLVISELNKLNCQSIITTHNTSIMTNDLLRPDCYFVMDEKSIKPLYAFTDKELREAHNIEKMYRAGAFQ